MATRETYLDLVAALWKSVFLVPQISAAVQRDVSEEEVLSSVFAIAIELPYNPKSPACWVASSPRGWLRCSANSPERFVVTLRLRVQRINCG